jgi:hypothetical protein
VSQAVAQPNNINVNVQNSGQINNTVNVAATSGNSTAANNSLTGNISTGNADAVANIVNVLNSAIGANSSFIGIINITGNLNGDILLPPNMISSLLASNAAAAPATTDGTTATNTTANITNNQGINNTVTTTANSGNATVTDNTKVGNVSTGNALTNLTLLNLTGKQVVGANDILVFVNVLGKWTGMIFSAPAGATAASLGGGITQDTSTAQNSNTTINSTNQITNNITVASKTGNATVTDNTKVGNVSTGNATASANILNITGSQISLSEWFGVLFINVFGTWNGWFGVNTIAGDPTSTTTPGATMPDTPTAPAAANPAPPKPAILARLGHYQYTPPAATGSQSDQSTPAVLGSTNDNNKPTTTITPSLSKHTQPSNVWIFPLLGVLLSALLLAGERLNAYRQRRAATTRVATA